MKGGHRAGAQIARDADFERNIFFPKTPHEIFILHGSNAVPNTFSPDVERGANALGPVCFSGVGRQAKTGVARVTKRFPKR